MPQPTLQQVHVDVPLTNISVAYIQSANAFIAPKASPIVPVPKKSDLFFKYTKNDWFRDEAKPRAGGTESAGSGYGLQTDNYTAIVYAMHKDVDEQTRANADVPLNPDRDATMFVTQRLLLRQEVQWAADAFGTGIWGTDQTVATQWSDNNSDPIGNVRTGLLTVLQNTGFLPNTLTLSFQTFVKLIDHPDIVDRIKYGASPAAPALVNAQTLAKVFGVDQVLVTQAVKATNNEGETAAYSFVHGKHALLTYVNPQPGILAPSAMYTFMWTGISQGLGTNIAVGRIPMPWLGLGTERIEGQLAFVNKIVASDLGYFFPSVVA